MNSNEFELLYNRFTWKEQTVRSACVISGIPVSLNYFKLDLQGRYKICVSLMEFNEFQCELLYIRFTLKYQTLRFAFRI